MRLFIVAAFAFNSHPSVICCVSLLGSPCCHFVGFGRRFLIVEIARLIAVVVRLTVYLFGWFVDCFAGCLVVWFVGRFLGWLVDCVGGWIGGLVGWSVGLFFFPSQNICLFVRLLVLFGWLVGQSAGRLLTCLVGRPAA